MSITNASHWSAQFAARKFARRAEPAPAAAARERAFDWFLAHGLPSVRDEDWKYTDVRAIAARAWRTTDPSGCDTAALGATGVLDLIPHRLIFVNGHWNPKISTPAPDGIRVSPIGETPAPFSDSVPPADGFAALNIALADEGMLIEARTGAAASLHIVYVTGAAPDMIANLRHAVIVAPGATLDLIETHIALDDRDCLSNQFIQIEVGAGAVLRHWQLGLGGDGARRIARTAVKVARDARYESTLVTLGGRLTRGSDEITLTQGAACAVHGLRVARGREHVDHQLRIVHAAPDTRSHTAIRSIVDDAARTVVSARVVVERGARGADAQQQLRNLLLSPEAEADTRPQLEIYADEVQCSHAATTGNLDPEALYYLRTRGLDAGSARTALIRAFADDIVSGIALEALRQLIDARLHERLREN